MLGTHALFTPLPSPHPCPQEAGQHKSRFYVRPFQASGPCSTKGATAVSDWLLCFSLNAAHGRARLTSLTLAKLSQGRCTPCSERVTTREVALAIQSQVDQSLAVSLNAARSGKNCARKEYASECIETPSAINWAAHGSLLNQFCPAERLSSTRGRSGRGECVEPTRRFIIERAWWFCCSVLETVRLSTRLLLTARPSLVPQAGD